ncbi:MAG: hypothetical protein HY072_03645 [Deltaproteobacteria bacterium]|nr:hypothetical protein [Deltaproteobacteria bacterium]
MDIHGPIYSRRFGTSIIINLRDHKNEKNCTWRCIYCPWKKENLITKSPEEFPSRTAGNQNFMTESLVKLRRLTQSQSDLKSVILSGNSDPTNYRGFEELVSEIIAFRKTQKGAWSLVCFTNGVALDNESVLNACESVDEIWVKLDCSNIALFQKLNRPVTQAESFKKQVENIGKLHAPCIQTMLWRNQKDFEYQNWTPENLKGLIDIYEQLKPAYVHLLTPKQESLFSAIQPVGHEGMHGFALRIEERGISAEVWG